ncbi:MAG: hypothetical protein ACTHKD_05015, partial [Devosia sp.]
GARMLKQSLIAATALISLASAVLPLMTSPAGAAACTSPGCGGTPPPPGGGNPPPPDGGNPPPPGGNPPPPDNNNPVPNFPDDPNFNPDGSRKATMLITCQVPKGGQTTSLTFRNIGTKTIPSGTPITCYVKATHQGGQFALPTDLPVGQDLTAEALLKLGVPANTPCLSKLS